MAMVLHTPADESAIQNIKGSEQAGGAISDHNRGSSSAIAELERQPWLGMTEGMDLGLFVERHDGGGSGRDHIEAGDVFELGDEVGIVQAFERSEMMKLQPKSLLDPLHCYAQRNSHNLGRGAAGPMGDLSQRLTEGQRDQPLNFSVRNRWLLPGFLLPSRRMSSIPASATTAASTRPLVG